MRLFFFALLGLLTACPSPSKPSTLYVPENSLSKPISTNLISSEEFQKRLESGELQLISDATLAANQQARVTQYQADLATLRGLANPSPTIAALTSTTNPDPNPTTGNLLLQDNQTTARSIVASIEQSQDPTKIREGYTTLYSLLLPDNQAQVPSPQSLQGQDLAAQQAALAQINGLLQTQTGLDDTQLEPNATAPQVASGHLASVRPQAINRGNGTDTNLGTASCRTPTGLVARYRFPLKGFISPIKNQAQRGLCWAFSAVGALESREMVQNGTAPNLSEQFLAYKVKAQWSKADYGDGYGAEIALSQLLNNRQNLPEESYWTYNPARGRQMVGRNDPTLSYSNSCDWTPNDPNPNRPRYTGTCSNTSHQGNAVCTTIFIGAIPFYFCAVETETYSGAGVAASPSKTAWTSGTPFLLESYRLLLANGYTLLATLPIYKGFSAVPTNGYLTDTRLVRDVPDPKDPTKTVEVMGSSGDHVVEIVGFISNETLRLGGNPSNVAGGGYFIVKNSWGCGWGDGGYAYVPAQYVQDVFYSLSYLDFDSRRSSAWQQTQANLAAPSLQLSASSIVRDLRVSSNLNSLISITHSSAQNVNLQVSSSTGQQIYNGTYTIGGLANSIPFTPTVQGRQLLTFTASYGSAREVKTLTVDVVNTAPQLNLYSNNTAYVYSNTLGATEVYVTIHDINESQVLSLCDTVRWETTGANLIEPDLNFTATGGCTRKIRFASAGLHQVRATVTDSDGLSTTASVNFTVQEPPANPYPIIEGGGVKLWDYQRGSLCIRTQPLATGATLDLRSITPSTQCFTGNANPTTYVGIVSINNPSNEMLEYQWTLWVDTLGGRLGLATSNTLNFAIPRLEYGVGGTFDCDLEVLVKPTADPSRYKLLRVWAGRCQIAPVVPR